MSPRPALRLFAAGVAIGLLALAIEIAGVGTWQLWVAFVLPDVALLAGAARGLERGQLAPRAVPLYNALHHPAGPLLAVIVAAALLPDAWLAAALAWGAHVAMDRAAGYGLRTREGFQRWPAAA
jgi:uncharacterized protein DUF4260